MDNTPNNTPTWISYQKHSHRIKITSDVDCLPPDATWVKEYGAWDQKAIEVAAAHLRGQGYTVEIDSIE